jgi:hypothetical protein
MTTEDPKTEIEVPKSRAPEPRPDARHRKLRKIGGLLAGFAADRRLVIARHGQSVYARRFVRGANAGLIGLTAEVPDPRTRTPKPSFFQSPRSRSIRWSASSSIIRSQFAQAKRRQFRYNGPMNWDRDWYPYAVAVAVAIAVAVSFWFFAMWLGG